MAAMVTAHYMQVEEQHIAAKVLGRAYILTVVELSMFASVVDIDVTIRAGKLGIAVAIEFVERAVPCSSSVEWVQLAWLKASANIVAVRDFVV